MISLQKRWMLWAICGVYNIANLQGQESLMWQRNMDFGLSLSKGNTDTSLVHIGIEAEKKLLADRYFGSFSYLYGEENAQTTQNEVIGKVRWKHQFANSQSYRGVRLDALSDSFSDIDYRFSLGVGYGHYWIQRETVEFSTELGLGITTEEKGEGGETYLNGLFDQHFEYQFASKAKIYQDLLFSPRIDRFEDYRIEFELGIETKITKTLNFKVSLENRFESIPAEGKKQNDLKLMTGVSYKF